MGSRFVVCEHCGSDVAVLLGLVHCNECGHMQDLDKSREK